MGCTAILYGMVKEYPIDKTASELTSERSELCECLE